MYFETILFQLIADLWKFSLVCVHLRFVSFFHIWNRNEYSMTHNLWLTSKISFKIFISSTKRFKFHFESAHLFSIFVHFRMNLFKLYFIATRFFFKIFTFFLKLDWFYGVRIGFIDVGDGCWRRNVLVTILRCWWRFWPFRSPTSSIS